MFGYPVQPHEAVIAACGFGAIATGEAMVILNNGLPLGRLVLTLPVAAVATALLLMFSRCVSSQGGVGVQLIATICQASMVACALNVPAVQIWLMRRARAGCLLLGAAAWLITAGTIIGMGLPAPGWSLVPVFVSLGSTALAWHLLLRATKADGIEVE